MREPRPEYYSDTQDQLAYLLDSAVFEYHLDTITPGNQTHDFEVFCRKLCEHAICPHLRPWHRGQPAVRDHRDLGVRSVIDLHTGDKAGWRGVAYPVCGNAVPPMIALMFENEEAAKNIFERWRERFSGVDDNGEIAISIIRRLPNKSDHHYCMVIYSKLPDDGTHRPGRLYMTPNRS
jgi:hypothetical protein